MTTTQTCINGSIVIVGCGGFGRETFAILRALDLPGAAISIEGFIDDSPSDANVARAHALGTHVIGTVEDLIARTKPYSCVLAVGSPTVRRTIFQRLAASPVHYPSIVHPSATVSPDVQLAAGLVVAPGARIATNVNLGEHVHVDQNVTVGHDAVVLHFTRINPSACVSGSVTLEEEVLLGANSTVLQGLRVGRRTLLGAGAVLTRDAPPDSTLAGVPAQPLLSNRRPA